MIAKNIIMRPDWTVYGQVIHDIRDEHTLNNCFIELVDDSLTRGPEFLNYILNGVVTFDEPTQIEATDREPLPHRDTGKNRHIDFTISDNSKLIGLE